MTHDWYHVIVALRLTSLLLWSTITFWALPAMARIFHDTYTRRDWVPAAMGLLGVGVCTFGIRALAGIIPPQHDFWTAFALLNFDLSGIGFFVSRGLHAPDEMKRAIFIVHVATVLLCLAAGLMV